MPRTDYRAEMDTLAAFLDECCTLAPNAQAKAAELFKAYQTWGGDDGQTAIWYAS